MNNLNSTRPVWAEINLDHLAHNIKQVKKNVQSNTLISAVIKADGYGHGAVHIAQTLLDNGADRLAVATLSEAIHLRRVYKEVPIMILGYTPNELAEQVILHNLIQTIFSVSQAKLFSEVAKGLGKTLCVHIKLDTGMRRIGMPICQETVQAILDINQFENLVIEGIFTHFAAADELDKAFTHLQVERFLWVTEALKESGLNIPIKHVSNSAAIIDCPEYNFNMVRAGIMLYGLYPSKEVSHKTIHLKEVMSLKAQVAQVKTVEAGQGISYGLKYVTREASQIATLPLGYADGFLRGFGQKAKGIVKNEIKPIVGRVCMDQCMIEVNGIDLHVGDEVTLFGSSENQFISIDTYAAYIETINYEIVCLIGKRVPRKYVQDGQLIHFEDNNLSTQVSSLW